MLPCQCPVLQKSQLLTKTMENDWQIGDGRSCYREEKNKKEIMKRKHFAGGRWTSSEHDPRTGAATQPLKVGSKQPVTFPYSAFSKTTFVMSKISTNSVFRS